jgi:hypothetical protein
LTSQTRTTSPTAARAPRPCAYRTRCRSPSGIRRSGAIYCRRSTTHSRRPTSLRAASSRRRSTRACVRSRCTTPRRAAAGYATRASTCTCTTQSTHCSTRARSNSSGRSARGWALTRGLMTLRALPCVRVRRLLRHRGGHRQRRGGDRHALHVVQGHASACGHPAAGVAMGLLCKISGKEFRIHSRLASDFDRRRAKVTFRPVMRCCTITG